MFVPTLSNKQCFFQIALSKLKQITEKELKEKECNQLILITMDNRNPEMVMQRDEVCSGIK